MSEKNEMRSRNAYVFLITGLVLVAIAVRLVYLMTAESTYDAEEVPLEALNLVSGNPAPIDISFSRLYGSMNITSGLSLALLGAKVYALKLPNLLFFLAMLVFLAALAWRLVRSSQLWIVATPAAMLALGPPVIQMWSLKNRGGFIETLTMLAIVLWMFATPSPDAPRTNARYFVIAVLMGIAIWMQPIAAVWVVPSVGYMCFEAANKNASRFFTVGLIACAGLLLGLMPLININAWHGLNTIRVMGGGEDIGVHLNVGSRALGVFRDGIPRLLGLKQQWKPEWVLPAPLAIALYVFFLAPAIAAGYVATKRSIRTRRLNLELLLVAIAGCVIAANLFSSWGNFVGEPRRLLFLYIPLVLLVAVALTRSKVFAGIYIAVWLASSVWSNYLYVRENPHGFADRAYAPMGQVARFLLDHGVTGVYTDVWLGNRVAFESGGKISWYRSDYAPTTHGYLPDGLLDEDEAALFDTATKAGSEQDRRFANDLEKSETKCQRTMVSRVSVYYGCSDQVDLEELASNAPRLTLEGPGKLFQVDTGTNAISGLYPSEHSHAWTRPHFAISFVTTRPVRNGYLCLELAPFRGTVPMVAKWLGAKKESITQPGMNAIALGDFAAGDYRIDLAVPAFLPSLAGAKDVRHLGLPLVKAELKQDGCSPLP